MKKLLTLTILAASLYGPLSAADLQVINVCNLTETNLQEIMQGLHPETAVEFSAHTTLPVYFFLKGDLAELLENDQTLATLQIRQTFYARYVQDEMMLSRDLTNWKPFFEFITGNASSGLTIQDGKPKIFHGAETHLRS